MAEELGQYGICDFGSFGIYWGFFYGLIHGLLFWVFFPYVLENMQEKDGGFFFFFFGPFSFTIYYPEQRSENSKTAINKFKMYKYLYVLYIYAYMSYTSMPQPSRDLWYPQTPVTQNFHREREIIIV